MAANNYRAPKQRELTENESLQTFESWRQNLVFQLRSDTQFTPFFAPALTWTRKRRGLDNRGFQNDPDDAENPLTAAQKTTRLELMLEQIANFAPVVSRRSIVNDSTSLAYVWQALRLHYGFHSTGANFIDFININLKPEERPETLYQRMRAFIDDNLLTEGTGILHHGQQVDEEDEIQPSLENLIVLMWLSKLHKDLPNLVKVKYGAELRSKTLASMKPEISQALDSLLEEVRDQTSNIRRSNAFDRNQNRRPANNSQRPFSQQSSRPAKLCSLCKAANRPDAAHFLSRCPYLLPSDKKFLSRARSITVEDTGFNSDDNYDEDNSQHETPANCGRVKVKRSPAFSAFVGHESVKLTLDSGAETNMIKYDVAKRLNLKINENSTQEAVQADGHSSLGVRGETFFDCVRGDDIFTFEGLVVENLQTDVLAGIPFQEDNDVYAHTPSRTIYFPTAEPLVYGPRQSSNRAKILRTTVKTTVWPNEFIELSVGKDAADQFLALESRCDQNPPPDTTDWPPSGIYKAVGDKIRIANTTSHPIAVKKNDHICQAVPVFSPPNPIHQEPSTAHARRTTQSTNPLPHSSSVIVNPDGLLSTSCAKQFESSLTEFDDVFNPKFNVYNQAFGRFEAVVNVGDVKPPQRKGRLPQYSRDKLGELQAEMDKLESLGVLAVPEQLGITVEYLNPSFLVKKPDSSWRLVTAFNEVGKYCKPQPSLMPNVDSTLRSIARWKFLIKTDLTKAFFQIPLSKDSMKYCGVVTPFKGVRVYTRCAMGMPGSETALEQLMCKILGSLVEEGCVAKIADDLYCGGNTEQELLSNWTKVLTLLHETGVKLSSSKTVIAPRETTILGWIWQQGTIRASTHRIAPLASCEKPKTTKAMRSFLGAYKVLARVIPHASSYLSPLDKMTHGKKSSDKLDWSEESSLAFQRAQAHLKNSKSITLPKEEDQLWIVTDGASSTKGLGAVLYAQKDNGLNIAGFFSQQLKPTHQKWFTCEVEGLSIAAAIKNFEGFIIQSKHRTIVLTDSKPCVDAYNKLLKGQFSSNARLSTYLSTISRHHVLVRHLAGTANLPADFASRNPVSCDSPESCATCNFATDLDTSVVMSVSTADILSGSASLPFVNRKAWAKTQSESYDLRRTRAHLTQGTRPSHKETSIKTVKQYLNRVTIASDGLIVFNRTDPFSPPRECIVVPREILHGLVMALHLRLGHPSTNEMSKVFKRYFWAISMDEAISSCASSCHQCVSLKKTPRALVTQSTSDPPAAVAYQFAADVMRRNCQLILIVREYVSAFTWAMVIPSEKHQDLRSALIRLLVGVVPREGPLSSVRTDAATGFQALVNDAELESTRIAVEIGNPKNVNKNPVAEKAIQEVEEELCRLSQPNKQVTDTALAKTVASLNSRIRTDGLSAREIMFQRDQFTNSQIPVNDRSLISAKHSRSTLNNISSAKSKAHGRPPHPPTDTTPGDLVYLYSEKDKHGGRCRYIVTSTDNEWCSIRKFTGSTLSNSAYRVKRSEVYKVPATTLQCRHDTISPDDEDDYHADPECEHPVNPAQHPHQPQEQIQPAQDNPPQPNLEPPGIVIPEEIVIPEPAPAEPAPEPAQEPAPAPEPAPAMEPIPAQAPPAPNPLPEAAQHNEVRTRSGRRVVPPARYR